MIRNGSLFGRALVFEKSLDGALIMRLNQNIDTVGVRNSP